LSRDCPYRSPRHQRQWHRFHRREIGAAIFWEDKLSTKFFTQTLTTELHESAIAAYAGYNVRWLANERQWAIQNPGDLDELLVDIRSGKQSVADALKLLRVYDSLRQLKFGDESVPKSKVIQDTSNPEPSRHYKSPSERFRDVRRAQEHTNKQRSQEAA
jgi:hypothetical protein